MLTSADLVSILEDVEFETGFDLEFHPPTIKHGDETNDEETFIERLTKAINKRLGLQ